MNEEEEDESSNSLFHARVFFIGAARVHFSENGIGGNVVLLPQRRLTLFAACNDKQ
jgi:hypothetical protein